MAKRKFHVKHKGLDGIKELVRGGKIRLRPLKDSKSLRQIINEHFDKMRLEVADPSSPAYDPGYPGLDAQMAKVRQGRDITAGLKFDTSKPDWSLLPLSAVEQVVRVLDFGAKKYAPGNWKKVRPKSRYYAAALRHLAAWQAGERKDGESGLPHLAHAACCILFLIWFETERKTRV